MIKHLVESFEPQHYQLLLDIDRDSRTFKGEVTIEGTLTAASKTIALHSKDLEIKTATINNSPATNIKTDKDDTLTLTSSQELQAGEQTVQVTFTGEITDAMHGMYPCNFEVEGSQKQLIATQFESHHAREVFPCVDEPVAKATFDLTLITPAGEPVLANTPMKKQSEQSGRLKSSFETTPKMSTYLLAFVFGEMHFLEDTTKDGIVIRSWATISQPKSWLAYSVEETKKLLEFYSNYFGTPFPLKKCDQVALPDFESGAMENWGLITYRETVLLSDPKNVSLSTQQLITLVVAHELSHQWFGNLVTMKWWDDLWLNESFANMTEYLATDALHPEWQIWEEFVAQDVVSATNRDVYKDVQPVRVAVNDPAEIHTLFDPSIVYAKGGKLLKMLRDLMGADAWRQGLKQYFQKHRYANTTRDDLWDALSNVTEVNVPSLMNNWIEHAGQPLLLVDQDGKKLQISQERLLLDGKDASSWQVPLLANNAPVLLTDRTQTFELGASNFVMLNGSGVGHYIVDYVRPAHKKWINEQVAEDSVPSEWKITYLNGLIMLCKAGNAHMSEALETIRNSSSEQRAAVWSQISTIVGSSRMIVEGSEQLEDTLKSLTYDLSKQHLQELGWQYRQDEPSNTTHLRTTAVALACASENKAVIKKALDIYESADNPEELPAEIRGILMSVAIRFGKKTEFNKLIDLYKASSNADFKTDISVALTSTKSKEQAEALTKLMLDTETIRTQDTIRWYIYLLRNRYVREVAWDWLTTNWGWIMQHFGGSKSYDDFARYSAAIFNSDEHLAGYKKFFGPKSTDPALKRTVDIGINEIQARSSWRKRDNQDISNWLEAYSATTR